MSAESVVHSTPGFTSSFLLPEDSILAGALHRDWAVEPEITEADSSVPLVEVQALEPTLSPSSAPPIPAAAKRPLLWIEPGHTGPSPSSYRRLSLQVR